MAAGNHGNLSHANPIKPDLYARAAPAFGDPNAEWVANPSAYQQRNPGAAATAFVCGTYRGADAQHSQSLHGPAGTLP